MGRIWHRLADFLENGDLVVFAVVISIYHYVKALQPAGDPLWVAIPVALFIDLLHFRTIRRAVESPGRARIGIAVATTIMALGYHLVFYSLAVAAWWQVWLYALPIPVGMGILAWHAAERDETDWQALALDRKRELESVRNTLESLRKSAKEEERLRQAAESSLKEEERARTDAESRYLAAESRVKELESIATYWQGANEKTKAALMYSAGHFSTLEEAAQWAGVSAPTISKQRKAVNGSA